MPAESTVEVLVIGAGPSGLCVAGELARHGVAARLIEKDPVPHSQTRATAVQPATLELFERAALRERILAAAHPVARGAILDAALTPAFEMPHPVLDTPYPFVASLPQCRTEAVLTAHLEALGGRVERGVCAETIALADDGSRVAVRHADGRRETIAARYVIGAGGAHGPLRGAMHEHLDGTTCPVHYLVADVRADIPLDRDGFYVAIAPVGLLMMAPLPESHWLLVFNRDGDGTPADPPPAVALEAEVARHLTRPFPIRAVRWASPFRSHRRIAPRFGDGHRFLVGDAAHICSPFGGEGMNAGLQDGFDLAWKLAAVCKGLGRPLLLEAYDAERRAAAAQILDSSEAVRTGYDALITMAAAGQPLAPATPDPVHPVTKPAMLDVAWPESPIVGAFGTAGTGGRPRPGERFPDRARLRGTSHHLIIFRGPRSDAVELERFRTRWRRQVELLDPRALGPDVATRAELTEGGALLVRPDGFVGYRAEPWNEQALLALDAHLARQFVPLA